MGYVLEPDEGILLEELDGGPVGDLDFSCIRILLTTKYIVFLDSDGANEDEYVIDKLALRDIRIYKNVPQMFITQGSYGVQLDIYFKDMTIGLVFGYYKEEDREKAYRKWLETITSVLKDNPSEDEESSTKIKRFCGNCGAKIETGGLFCKYCGNKLSDDTKSSGESSADSKDDVINSGDISESQMGKCPNCGALIKSFSFSCEFCGYEFRNKKNSMKIEEFENEYHKTRSLSQRISLVQSLPISSSKESLLEVFYLASANVGRFEKTERKLEQAWQSKFEQAYLKAGSVLRNDPELDRVEKIYTDKKKELEKKQKQSIWDKLF